jgi:sn-glycerol 3-phosphate transport system substrate-binding protein
MHARYPKLLALATGAALALSFAQTPALAEDRTEIELWHAMEGGLGVALREIVDRFNESQDKYQLNETYKGRYRVVLNNTIAAYRAGEQPHIFQTSQLSVITLLLSDAVVPVEDILDANDVEVDLSAYLPPVVDTYVADGKIFGMPFNSSTPIMWYNADLLREAGFEEGPETWQDMEEVIRTAQEKGIKGADGDRVCGFAYSGGLWQNVENWSSIHDQPYATLGNGRDGLGAELLYNTTEVVTHLKRMVRWLDEGLAEFGAENPADFGTGAYTNWISGNCLFLNTSSAAHPSVESVAEFNWGASFFPYDSDIIDEPRNSTIGGGAFYVMKGFSEEEHAGIAEFFRLLTSVEVQKRWHTETGYVPITKAAYEDLKSAGYYEENPSYEIAVLQLLRGEPGPNNRVPRVGNFQNVRIQLEAELQKVYGGEQDIDTALSEGVRRGNELLRRFEKQNSR